MNKKLFSVIIILYVFSGFSYSQAVEPRWESAEIYPELLNLEFSNSPTVEILDVCLSKPIEQISSSEQSDGSTIYRAKAFFDVDVDLSLGYNEDTNVYRSVTKLKQDVDFLSYYASWSPSLLDETYKTYEFLQAEYNFLSFAGALSVPGYIGQIEIDGSFISDNPDIFDIETEEYNISSKAFIGQVIEIQAITHEYEDHEFQYKMSATDLHITQDYIPSSIGDFDGLRTWVDTYNLGLHTQDSVVPQTTPTVQHGEKLAPQGVFSVIGDQKFKSSLTKMVPNFKHIHQYLKLSYQELNIDDSDSFADAHIDSYTPIVHSVIDRTIGWKMTTYTIHQTLQVEVDIYATVEIEYEELDSEEEHEIEIPPDQIENTFWENTLLVTKEFVKVDLISFGFIVLMLGLAGIIIIFFTPVGKKLYKRGKK